MTFVSVCASFCVFKSPGPRPRLTYYSVVQVLHLVKSIILQNDSKLEKYFKLWVLMITNAITQVIEFMRRESEAWKQWLVPCSKCWSVSAVMSLEFTVVPTMTPEIVSPAVIVADLWRVRCIHLGILHMVLKLWKCICVQIEAENNFQTITPQNKRRIYTKD